jgi:peroxiredoxin Q/BCP
VGSKAPPFKLPDQTGDVVDSTDLAGKPYVIYFYPRDNTSGCTREACDFRDARQDFETHGVRIIGVSRDSAESHAGFAEKYSLPFTLLADSENQLISAYGSWVEKQNYGRKYMGIQRSTFVVDENGVIQKAWRSVKVNGHVAAVLEQAKQLS